MRKRIALFVLGFVLAVGIFLLYQQFSGAGMSGAGRLKPAATGPAASMPYLVEKVDEKGRLLYQIKAAGVEQLKDVNGRPLQGQVKLDHPEAIYYSEDGGTLAIQADRGLGVLDSAAQGSGGSESGGGGLAGGGKYSSAIRSGELSGHVMLTITGKSFGSPVRVYFDGPVDLDGADDILSTPGMIHLRSRQVDFDGADMKLAISRTAAGKSTRTRIEYLRIEKGDQLIVRGIGPQALAMTDQSATKPAKPAPATATAPATDKAPEPPVTYRLSFATAASVDGAAPPDIVRAALGKNNSLAAESLSMLFVAASSLRNQGPATFRGAPTEPAGTAPDSQPAGDLTHPAPLAPPDSNDMVVTWSGPMEMRPATEKDLPLNGEKDVALEALGSAQRPVHLLHLPEPKAATAPATQLAAGQAKNADADQRFEATAGRLWYHANDIHNAARIELEPGDFQQVLMNGLSGDVACKGANIDQGDLTVALLGPGTMIIRNLVTLPATPPTAPASAAKPPAPKEPSIVKWDGQMDLQLEKIADAKDPKKSDLAVRHALLHDADVASNNFDIKSDLLDVTLANVSGNKSPAPEHLLATGHVVMHSRRAVDGQMVADGGMTGDRLELWGEYPEGLAPAPGTQPQVAPATWRLLADAGTGGAVDVWQFADKRAAAAKAPAWEKSEIKTPRLEAQLIPDPKGPTTRPADETGLGSLGSMVVAHARATDAHVERTPPPGREAYRLVADAGLLDTRPLDGFTLLQGPMDGNGKRQTMRVAMGENYLEGPEIRLGSKKDEQSVEVPGAGSFYFLMPSKDKDHPEPTPMQVAWEGMAQPDGTLLGMQYDQKQMFAQFWGKTVAQSTAPNGSLAKLKCDQTLLIKLKSKPEEPASPTAPAGRAGQKPPAKPSSPLPTDDFLVGQPLEPESITAVGNVDIGRAVLDDNGKELSAMDLQTGKLIYLAANQSLNVPGAGKLVVENFKKEKAPEPAGGARGASGAGTGGAAAELGGGMTTEGTSHFSWDGSLAYLPTADPAVHQITFEKNVQFIFRPAKPFNIPGANDSKSPANTVFLSADRLLAKVEKADKPETSPKLATSRPKPGAPASAPADNLKKSSSVPGALDIDAGTLADVRTQGYTDMHAGDYQLNNESLQLTNANSEIEVTGWDMDVNFTTKLAVISGHGADPARFQPPGKLVSADQVLWDFTKDEQAFRFIGIRGNIGGMEPLK